MHFSLSDLVADIAQNAAESGARVVKVTLREEDQSFCFNIQDDGDGMTEMELQRALDPFYTDGKKHPGRRVGLGLPFLIQCAEASGGKCNIRSEKGKGTTVDAWFDKTHMDVPPVGDIPTLIRTIVLYQGPEEIILRRTSSQGAIAYEVKKSELQEALGNLENAGALVMLGRYLQSLEEYEEAAEED